MRRSFPDFFETTPTPDTYIVGKSLVSKGPAVSPRQQASCRDVETNSGCWEAEGRFGHEVRGVLEWWGVAYTESALQAVKDILSELMVRVVHQECPQAINFDGCCMPTTGLCRSWSAARE